ncbi:MAG: ABC transporter substrate-binding protein [Gammaproteobacteria bacterium]
MSTKSRICVAAIAACMVSTSALAAVPESTDPIQVIDNNWSSQKVLARVAKQLLEQMGYKAELVTLDTQSQFAAMGTGDAHIQMEVWEGTMHASFTKEVEAGRMTDGGAHAATTREEWWYPEYVEEVCPGLPDYKALNDCAEKLSTPETAPNARYLAGPAEWHPEDAERVEALGLNVTVVNAGSADALFGELKSAAKRKEPIILFNWAPNWVGAAYPGKFIEFPRRDPENKCVSDPGWGINKDMTNDCGAAVGGYLKKGLWAGFAKKYPCANDLMTNINFTEAMINAAAALVDVDGLDHDAAAAKWIEQNKEVVGGWVPACAG